MLPSGSLVILSSCHQVSTKRYCPYVLSLRVDLRKASCVERSQGKMEYDLRRCTYRFEALDERVGLDRLGKAVSTGLGGRAKVYM